MPTLCAIVKIKNKTMGLLNIFNKSTKPFKNAGLNLFYDLLFCDNLDLYKKNSQNSDIYPWDILFSDLANISDLQKIIEDKNAESRTRILAYNKLIASGQKTEKKELLAVIVEVGLDRGLDVLASFSDGTARYINQTEKLLVWETKDEKSNKLTTQLFAESSKIVSQIGPWDKPRRQHPTKGNVRITFLVSDGLYFGEGPINVLFNDPLASSALTASTELMKYLTEKSLEKN
jgi:hypothetical protein